MNKRKIITITIGVILLISVVGAVAIIASPYGGLFLSTIASKTSAGFQTSGIGCGEDVDCVKNLATKCEVGNSQFDEDGIEGIMQILAKEERGCKVYIRIDKHPDIPPIIGSLDSTCWFAPKDIPNLDPATINIGELDCEGPLFEATKTMG